MPSAGAGERRPYNRRHLGQWEQRALVKAGALLPGLLELEKLWVSGNTGALAKAGAPRSPATEKTLWVSGNTGASAKADAPRPAANDDNLGQWEHWASAKAGALIFCAPPAAGRGVKKCALQDSARAVSMLCSSAAVPHSSPVSFLP